MTSAPRTTPNPTEPDLKAPVASMQSELQPPLDALARAERDGHSMVFADAAAVAQPVVHPLDEPFDPNQPLEDDDAAADYLRPTTVFNFRGVIMASGIVLCGLLLCWLHGSLGGVRASARMLPPSSSSRAVVSAPAEAMPPPVSYVPQEGSPTAAPVQPAVVSVGAATSTPTPPALVSPQAAVPELAPANPADLPASNIPSLAPPEDPLLTGSGGGSSAGGAPMNPAGAGNVSPIRVDSLMGRSGDVSLLRRGRTIQPSSPQIYETRAQGYLARASDSLRLDDRKSASADFRRAYDLFNQGAAHGEDAYTAQSGMQAARDGLKRAGGA